MSVNVFESVNAFLNPTLFIEVTQNEITRTLEKIVENTSVQLNQSCKGLLLTGDITELEIAAGILDKELIRKQDYTLHQKRSTKTSLDVSTTKNFEGLKSDHATTTPKIECNDCKNESTKITLKNTQPSIETTKMFKDEMVNKTSSQTAAYYNNNGIGHNGFHSNYRNTTHQQKAESVKKQDYISHQKRSTKTSLDVSTTKNFEGLKSDHATTTPKIKCNKSQERQGKMVRENMMTKTNRLAENSRPSEKNTRMFEENPHCPEDQKSNMVSKDYGPGNDKTKMMFEERSHYPKDQTLKMASKDFSPTAEKVAKIPGEDSQSQKNRKLKKVSKDLRLLNEKENMFERDLHFSKDQKSKMVSNDFYYPKSQNPTVMSNNPSLSQEKTKMSTKNVSFSNETTATFIEDRCGKNESTKITLKSTQPSIETTKMFKDEMVNKTSSQTAAYYNNNGIAHNGFHSKHRNATHQQKAESIKNHSENSCSKFTEARDISEVATSLSNNVSVRIIQGDLTNHVQADVIVNPTNSGLQNVCGIGALIIDTGGLSIQRDLNDELGCRDMLPPGKIITTTAGFLPFKSIFHVVCPEWTKNNEPLMILHKLCLDCLVQFSKTKLNTIAFPLLSSPYCPIPEDICAQIMLDAVAEFTNTTEPTDVMNIHFVLDQENSYRIFQTELNKLMNRKCSEVTAERSLQKYPKSGKIKEIKKNPKIPNEDKKCPVCLEKIYQPKTLEKCQHTFCKQCVDRAFQVKKICPLCKVSYAVVLPGNQPTGKMSFTKESSSLAGYGECGTIVITYTFKGGIQGRKHPNPGDRYEGASYTAYLPDNREGNEILSLLKIAFDNRLIFTIRRLRNVMPGVTWSDIGHKTSREGGYDKNVMPGVTWSDIGHKTSREGGYDNYGYPDPDYLIRVKEKLANKGIFS